MSWSNIEIIIPSVLSIEPRAKALYNLLIQISQQCPDTWVRILPQYNRPQNLAEHAYKVLSNGFRDFSHPWVLLIEDDVLLSDQFGTLVPDILNNAESDIGAISFFSIEDNHLWKGTPHLYEFTIRPFYCTQCIAMRKEVAEHWGQHMIEWKKQYPHYSTPDLAFANSCDSLNKKIMIYLPNLAQHIKLTSAFNHKVFPFSLTFGK